MHKNGHWAAKPGPPIAVHLHSSRPDLASRLRTVVGCHCPFRAVRMPMALSSAAIRLLAPRGNASASSSWHAAVQEERSE